MENALLDFELQLDEPMRPVDRRYSGVLLLPEPGMVTLQRRDHNAGIINPGMITLFGGVNRQKESDVDRAIREVREELDVILSPETMQFLGFIDKMEPDSSVTRCAIFVAPGVDLSGAVLREGASIEIDTIERFLQNPAVSAVCQIALLAL